MEIKSIGPQGGGEKLQGAIGGSSPIEKSFMDTLNDSIRQVNDAQTVADQSVQALVSGGQQDLHQTMIALEKANVSFQLMMSVRNKIVSAYEEVSRMQV